MKEMKKNLNPFAKLLLISITAGTVYATPPPQTIQPNFELWNKHEEPVYFSISNSVQEARKKPFEMIKPGKWAPAKIIDTKMPTVLVIAVGKKPEPGQRIDIYTIKSGKTIYARVGLPAEKEKLKETLKEFLGRTSIEANGYIFGPQTGPLLGVKGVTEHGYPLKKNISKNDITKSSAIYL
jgi:hypothetical protein